MSDLKHESKNESLNEFVDVAQTDSAIDPKVVDDPNVLDKRPAWIDEMGEVESEKIYSKATRKVDLLVMPPLILMYVLNYLDRQNITAARLANIERDINMTAVQYQTCISILFVGYILMQVPSNIIVGKVTHPAMYINFCMAVWGVVSTCTGAVQNFSGLVVCRFFLGFVEAVFFPGALFYLSTFYTRKQLATRTAILYGGSQLGNAFGGLLAVAILTLDGKHGIEGWRWLFIIEGSATVGIAIILGAVMPSSPRTAKWLDPREREFILWRLHAEQGASDNKKEISGWQGFKMAINDPKTWLLMGTLYFNYFAAAVISFFPSVVQTLGYSRNITYVLTAPPYIFTIICMSINGWHSDRTQERFWHCVSPLAFAFLSFIIALSTLNTGARYFAMMLMPSMLYSSSIIVLAWVATSMTQPSVKRAVALAFINAVCNTPNIYTTYFYIDAPRYAPAFGANIGSLVICVCFAVATRVYLAKKNAELDRGDTSARGAPTERQLAEGFRYTL